MSRIGNLWRILNLPCREAARLASESLDRDLDRFERLALKSHLFTCAACRRFRNQLLFLRLALHRLSIQREKDEAIAEIGLPDDVRAQIKQALKEHGFPNS